MSIASPHIPDNEEDIILAWPHNNGVSADLAEEAYQSRDCSWTGSEEAWPERISTLTTIHNNTKMSTNANILEQATTSVGKDPASYAEQTEMATQLPINERNTIVMDETRDSDYSPVEEEDSSSNYSNNNNDMSYAHDLGESTNYTFRPQRRAFKTSFTSTWMDHDTTGDFDPAEEARQERARQARIRQRPRPRAHSDEETTPDSIPKREPQPKVRLRLTVTLGLPSESSKQILRQLPSETPVEHEDTFEGYRLRGRLVRNDLQDGNNPSDDDSIGSRGVLPDHLGHPAARGCWDCLSLGVDCSLLNDERQWPCVTCIADGSDCVLIIPPTRKRPCSSCNPKHANCSYAASVDHSLPCLQCRERNKSCVAGPALDAIRPRIRYDRDWTADPLPGGEKRTVLLCEQCGAGGKPCWLSQGGEDDEVNPSCTACDMSGENCIVQSIQVVRYAHRLAASTAYAPAKKRRKISPKKSRANAMSEDDNGVVPSIELGQQTEAETKIIRTKFSHPIQFNCVDTSDVGKPCHFCSQRQYPILGLEERDVEVIDWSDGKGLEEIDGGHRGDGVENTRVCIGCTNQRMEVIMCQQHEMRPIAGVIEASLDLNAAFSDLMSPDSMTTNHSTWCSVCCNLASYQCQAVRASGDAGCGLVLCEHCAVTLAGAYDGDLQTMLVEAKDEATEQRPLGLRADWELLKQDGLLVRYVMWSTDA